MLHILFYQLFSSVQSLSRVQLFATPCTAARQASLSITNSQSPPKPMSIELMMPFNHLILCCPLLLLPFDPSQHQGLFQWVSSSHQVAEVLEFQLQHQYFQWIFRVDFLIWMLVKYMSVFSLWNSTVESCWFCTTFLNVCYALMKKDLKIFYMSYHFIVYPSSEP